MLTLTLKNIPAHLHAKLKESAEKNRRSLNSEILTRLERDVVAGFERRNDIFERAGFGKMAGRVRFRVTERI